jgi:transcriptional regulator with XRE-family HTH domain
MKRCEVYKCRRQALGWSKEKLSEKLGLKVGVIEKYENGENIPYCFEVAIKQTIDNEFTNVDKMTHYKRRILELAIQLNYEEEVERSLHDIGHMMVELGKMQMDIMQDIL